MIKKKATITDGTYQVVNGKMEPVFTAPKIGKNGLCSVWYKKTGKKYEMFPVDAKEALQTGDYLDRDPNAVDPDAEDEEELTEKDIWKDSEDRLLPLTDETSTKDGLIKALIANGQQVRGNDSKAEILAQWNDYVKESMMAE